MRNNHVFADTLDGCCQFPDAWTISAATSKMTMVRINVAKSELTFSMPIFAKMAVRAANPAESSAQNTQESRRFFIKVSEQTTGRDQGINGQHHRNHHVSKGCQRVSTFN